MILEKNFQVSRASAGSGKTYILSLSFIALALKGADKYSIDYYKRILAVTFTNKAAAEMKERVLQYLETLSKKDNESDILDWVKEATGFSEDKVSELSHQVRINILHNYTELKISTIDKFTYNIVRTFSSDLGLSYNFDVEMDNYKIIQPVVSKMLSRISEKGGPISTSLVNFALEKAEDGKSINIQRDLEEFCEHLFKEESLSFIGSDPQSLDVCISARDDMYLERRKIISDIKRLALDAIKFFNSNGLTKDHFIRGSFYNHFTVHLLSSIDSKWMPSKTLQNNINSDIWYKKGNSEDMKQLVEDCKSDLIYIYDQLMVLLKDYNTIQSLTSNIYSIAVLNELLSELNQYKKDQNLEQISVFNKKIHEVIVNQPSNFIYERIGERYNHFLIDEFQDTSLLQWQNILPLITDAIDYGTCFIVGDGKQSIYRWRGGEVEQFIALPKIFKGESLAQKKEWERKLSSHYINYKNDNQNYRSRRAIVEFNNMFFKSLSSQLSSGLQKIYDGCSQGYDKAKQGGYVHLELIKDNEDGFKENTISKIIEEITILKTRNKFQNKDICILCNSRKSVSLVSERLSQEGINVISSQGLLLNSSHKVRVVVASLYFLMNKNDILSKTIIMDFLQKRSPIKSSMHDINKSLVSEDGFNSLLKDFGVKMLTEDLLRLPLYEVVENLYKALELSEDIYTSFFLDMILSFSESSGSDLPSFLEWWEDKKDKESVVVPEGTDAVQVMTIHQSKGLAFNVVMLPFNWSSGRTYNEIWVDAANYTNNKLRHALVRGSKQLENSYFSNEYKREEDMKFLDNLNKLYVAMTRPIERLYVFAKEYPKDTGEKFQSSGKLNSFLYLYGISDKLIIGDDKREYIKKHVSQLDVFNVSFFKKKAWREILSLKSNSNKSWYIEDNSEKKDWGNLLHFALSNIKDKGDILRVAQDVVLEGLCDISQQERLIYEIQRILSHKDMIEFFNDKWVVRNEVEVLMSNGDSYIPDRLLFSDHRTVVIDYKTGDMFNNHKDQITNYASILSQMGYTNIEKYLVYTSSKKLVHKV